MADSVWVVAFVSVWILLLVEGLFLLFLYRQVGLHLLNRVEAVNRDGLKLGSAVPSTALLDAKGHPVRISHFSPSQYLLIFGSATCIPCKTLLPDLFDFAHSHRNLRVLFICGSSLADSQNFFFENGFNGLDFLCDPERTSFKKFKVRVTPFGFLIRAGTIRSKGLVNNKAHLKLLLSNAKKRTRKGLVGHRSLTNRQVAATGEMT